MNDPTLARTNVRVAYTSSDGFRYELTTRGGVGTANEETGDPVPPELGLLAALEELARLTALFGFEVQAQERFDAARQRVVEWKAKRAGTPAPPKQPDPLTEVRAAIEGYYRALDRRAHGGVAQSEALQKIERALGMQWNPRRAP